MATLKKIPVITLVISISALLFFWLSGCSNNQIMDKCSPSGIEKITPRPTKVINVNQNQSTTRDLKRIQPLDSFKDKDLGLQTPGTLTIGSMSDAPPNACANSNGVFTGYDNEMIKAAATKLGLKTKFVANDFSALLENTARGNFDVASSSINATDARRKMVDFSNPYDFAYSALMVPKESNIQNFKDVYNSKNVGVILGTIEDDYANQNHIPVVKFPDYVTIVNKLKAGQLDAWIAPATQAVVEAEQDENLIIKEYVFSSNNFVGWAVSKDNPILTDALNSALDEIIKDGTWMKLFEKWVPRELPENWKPGSPTAVKPDTSNLDKALKEKDFNKTNFSEDSSKTSILAQLKNSFFDWNIIKDTFPSLIKTGLKNTLIVTFFATIIALLFGSILALASISPKMIFRYPARIYTEILRGLPELLVVMLIGIGLQPIFKNVVGTNPQPLGIIGLGLLASAYMSEILRSGLNSVPKEQLEAADALGLNRWQVISNVLIPLGYRKVLPAILNQVISILKASSLLFIIGLTYEKSDIFTLAKISNGYTGNLSPLVAAGICYLLITIPLSIFVNYLDNRLNSERN